jgi:hypothetical protein
MTSGQDQKDAVRYRLLRELAMINPTWVEGWAWGPERDADALDRLIDEDAQAAIANLTSQRND